MNDRFKSLFPIATVIGLSVLTWLAYLLWPQIHVLIDAFSNRFNF